VAVNDAMTIKMEGKELDERKRLTADLSGFG